MRNVICPALNFSLLSIFKKMLLTKIFIDKFNVLLFDSLWYKEIFVGKQFFLFWYFPVCGACAAEKTHGLPAIAACVQCALLFYFLCRMLTRSLASLLVKSESSIAANRSTTTKVL